MVLHPRRVMRFPALGTLRGSSLVRFFEAHLSRAELGECGGLGIRMSGLLSSKRYFHFMLQLVLSSRFFFPSSKY